VTGSATTPDFDKSFAFGSFILTVQ
jgi:hypothetical protein